jgi:hypothetical protein
MYMKRIWVGTTSNMFGGMIEANFYKSDI